MNSKVLLIRPPSVMRGSSFIASQFPLNIAGIAAILINNGYKVDIWDFDVEQFSENSFVKRLKVFNPAVVGISCYTPTIINGHKIASIVKKCMPDVLTVVGGPHVSALPKETLKEFDKFDIGVIGEGEETMLELMNKLAGGYIGENIAGIVYRKEGACYVTINRHPIKDFDKLPLPARQLLNLNLYKGQSHRGFSRNFLRITEIMTSRGCPNRCIFCASDIVMSDNVRFKSSNSVKYEIGECVDRYRFNHFTVSDDTFTLVEDRLYEICDEFARRKVTWNCNGRVWPISKKMLLYMAKSGCIGITFGVESGSPRILKLIRKNITIEQIANAFRWSEESGIRLVEADIIIGSHPSETKEDINMTKGLLRKISPDIIMVSVAVPYPGTELYNIMKKDGHIFCGNRWDSFVLFGKKPSWKTDNFHPKELITMQKNMIFSFYFRPLYILRIFSKLKSVNEVIYWLRGGIEFLVAAIKST